MDHGTSDPDHNRPAVRASDAERHETARLLQKAFAEGRLTVSEFDERTEQVYQARFRTELAELTVDLSPAHGDMDFPPALWPDSRDDRTPASRVTGQTGTIASVAVMSGCDRSGPWTLATSHIAVAVMGGITIDLREAYLQSSEVTVRAFAVWGGIEILVPDDLNLVMDGFGLMGGFAEESGAWEQDPRPVRQAPPGAPTVRVTGLALMGGVGVRRVPRRES
ncbi:DUF1707 SHOCT-like domain-containing protein [Dietzia alimentaria]|uniref:DUF1707 SHOCT-like domain-containing protein n=1 Tax=Dietzia alimentaria TaxID=665550 RepID=UPI00029B4F51|nr:DUF1707 domain-containing protein [Dietzia alimentaria]